MPHPLAPQLLDAGDPNALADGVWPAGAERVDGAVRIGGADLREVAQAHGTPFLLVDEAVARGRARRIREAFEAAFDQQGVDVYYAGKALLTADVARWMRAEGLRIDVCTGGELAIALRAGVEPEAIGFHGNNKGLAEIEAGVAAGVGTFVLDSAIEAERVAAAAERAGRVQRVRLRISVGVHASTHEFLATSHEDQKFGVPVGEAPALVARIRELPSLELVGPHTHIGSQIFDASGFAESARRMLAMHAELGADAPLPEAFTTAQDLTPDAHIAVQAAVQPYIDSSISKTINCPADISFEAFKDIYTSAYKAGLKGCTTYRPSEVRGSVLSISPAESPAEEESGAPVFEVKDGVVYMSKPLERDAVLPGYTYKLQWPESDHAIYITLNDIIQDKRRRPFEIFINSKNMEHYAWTVALTRMISAVFRRGGDVTFVVEELKAVFDPRGGSWMNGRYVPSLLAAIGETIERHMIDIGFIAKQDGKPLSEGKLLEGAVVTGMKGCPRCGERGLVRQEGCDTCTSCGYSKCS